ncbi:MAG: hypothetical protein IT376_10065 [Polyangiaceae bacterium]|nr:hypothetical protein [Polyangiaceae bacterium]
MRSDATGAANGPPPPGGAVARWLASPVVLVLAPLLAVALSLSALGAGRQLEEWAPASAHGPIAWESLARELVFGAPPPARHEILASSYVAKDLGHIPWYASPELRVALRRPLAALSHRFDAWAAPGGAWFAHAHSLTWLAAFVLVAALALRRVLGAGPVAGLAALVLACDDSRGVTVGWLSNRTALLSWTFGLLAFLALDAAAASRRPRARAGLAVASGLATWLALSAGEYGLGALAWLLAHAAFLDPRPARARLVALAPTLAAVATWGAAYVRSGSGATGSGAYLSPVAAPWRSLVEGSQRALLLLAGAFGPPLEPAMALGPSAWPWALAAFYALLAASCAVVAWLTVRSVPARFLAVAGVGSVLPLTGALPSERLLGLTAVAVSALIALGLAALVAPARPLHAWLRWLRPPLVAAWLLSHVVLAAWLAPSKARGLAREADTVRRLAASALDGVPPSAQLVLVNSPGAYLGAELVRAIHALPRPPPDRVRVLHGGDGRLLVDRVASDTLGVVPEGGFCAALHARVYLSPEAPWAVDSGVQLRGVRVLVDAVDATGCPTRARFVFARGLEGEGVVVKHLVDGEYRRLALPPVGERLLLGGAAPGGVGRPPEPRP